jgi:hypothetical protein
MAAHFLTAAAAPSGSSLHRRPLLPDATFLRASTNHAATNPTLQFVTNVAKSVTQLNNVSALIHGSFSQLYVEMIGMPLIMNQMSNAANY